jgi:formate hydrogenlyase subunit 3/multisubunit Na+/H+ antiporter MnhD subunit
MIGPILLVATLGLPFAMLLACLSPRLRSRVPPFLVLAPLPGLAAALLTFGGEIAAFLPAPLRMTLVLDSPAAILLGTVAFLWIAAAPAALQHFSGDRKRGDWVIWWLMTLIGNLGVFIAADLVSFYLVFALVSLSAYGLVVADGSARARRAGTTYVVLGLLGEACLLLGFVQLAAASDSLLIRDGVAALAQSPWRDSTLALLMVGFGLKIGLVPLHVWIPLAHSAAPLPVSVVLSGAVVKAGVIGLIRFLPYGEALPFWGYSLAAAGLFSAFYGVAIGVTQANPKTKLAYSTISQLGLIGAVLGMGLASGNSEARLAASFYAGHHVLAKGGLFLAVGILAANPSRRAQILALTLVLGLSLAGLPLTGGALAKAAIKPPLGDGFVGHLALLSAAGTSLLIVTFVRALAAVPPGATAKSRQGLTRAWLATAAASLALPLWLCAEIDPHTLTEVLAPAKLAAALAPIVVGWLLAGLVPILPLPAIPEGDIIGFYERLGVRVSRSAAALERLEAGTRQWPVAALSLVGLLVVIGVALCSRP